MNTRIALIGIIVEREESVEQLNRLLHELSGKIGRLDGISAKTVYSNVMSNE